MPKYYDDEDHAYFLQVTQEMQSLHTTTCVMRAACSHHSLPLLTLVNPLPVLLGLRRNYLNLAQTAFRVCVHSFLHSEITDREEKCQWLHKRAPGSLPCPRIASAHSQHLSTHPSLHPLQALLL